MDAFHRAFAPELREVIGSLPLRPEMRVVDVGCGDGFYLGLLAQRLRPPGVAIGFDVNPSYLQRAHDNRRVREAGCRVDLVAGRLAHPPLERENFDLVWCAQSLYSLPEPVAAVEQMAALLRPGGVLAVLENDTLHQILLPWPSHLEIALRAAEFVALSQETSRPGKYYVGRRLPAVLAAGGLAPVMFRTQCIDRQAPLNHDLETFLELYFQRLVRRVHEHLRPALLEELTALTDPGSSTYLLKQPHFTMSWLNVLALGRRPASE
jgi:SAM-dependent methyltransferase